MLDIDEIFNRLQCCYSCLVSEQISNIEKLISDDSLDYKITKAYSLIQLRINGYLVPKDYSRYLISVNEVCGGCDCNKGFQWIGIEGFCENDTVNTTTSTTTNTTTSTSTTTGTTSTSSTSSTTKLIPPPSTTSTSTTTQTTSTSTTTQTSTTSTSSTSTTTVQGVETTIVPNWITGVAFSFDSNTHEGSLYNNTNQSTELRIQATDGSNPSGISSDGFVWSDGIWIPGTTQFAAPYSKVFRLNPAVNGVGGLIPGKTYKLSFRRVGDNSLVFVKNYTVPSTSQGITAIDLGITPTTTITSSTSTTTQAGQTSTTSSSTSTTTSPVGNTTYVVDGKRVTVQNGVRYAIINSQYAILSVLSNGNVKLTYTQASRSADNGTACFPVTMFNYMTDDFNGELAALKSTNGLALPKGTHLTLFTYWTDPALFTKLSEAAGGDIWLAWGKVPEFPGDGNARNHNGGIDWCSIEVY